MTSWKGMPVRRAAFVAILVSLLLGMAPGAALAAGSQSPPGRSTDPGGTVAQEGTLGAAGGTSGGVSPNATVNGNPYGCVGQSPSPHPSGSVIRAHATMTCSIRLSGYVYASLWRSRWYGYEKMAENSYRNAYASYWDTTADWNPGSNCHYYRNNGRFEVYSPTGTYTLALQWYDQRYLNGLPEGCGVNW
jgi:hypothetical protein